MNYRNEEGLAVIKTDGRSHPQMMSFAHLGSLTIELSWPAHQVYEVAINPFMVEPRKGQVKLFAGGSTVGVTELGLELSSVPQHSWYITGIHTR